MPAMHPIPSGTRDVLPDEMREQLALLGRLRTLFADHGYEPVATPAIEFTTQAGRPQGGPGVYRLSDDHGAALQLRADMTVPIARVAATRYADVAPPLRFSSIANVYRQVRPHRGQMREFLQAGCELIGVDPPEGTVEIVTVAGRALDAAGLADYRIGLGDASLYRRLLDELAVPADRRPGLLAALAKRDFVALEVAADGLDPLVVDAPGRRGGIDVLDGLPGTEHLRAVVAGLAEDLAARVIVDLGLVRDLDYYTGVVFELYDPALGAPIGGGGRYDELVGRFGRPLPAAGFALGVDALHEALTR